jgi:hypothetical protein
VVGHIAALVVAVAIGELAARLLDKKRLSRARTSSAPLSGTVVPRALSPDKTAAATVIARRRVGAAQSTPELELSADDVKVTSFPILMFAAGILLIAISVAIVPPSPPNASGPIVAIWTDHPARSLCILVDVSEPEASITMNISANLPPGVTDHVLVQVIGPKLLAPRLGSPTPSDTIEGVLAGPSSCTAVSQTPSNGEVATMIQNNQREDSLSISFDSTSSMESLQTAGSHSILSVPDIVWGTARGGFFELVGSLVTPKDNPFIPRRSDAAWAAPTGQLVVLGPSFLGQRTDYVEPPQAIRRVWISDIVLDGFSATWRVTDIDTETSEQRQLFIAGILLGIAGGAIVAGCQMTSWSSAFHYFGVHTKNLFGNAYPITFDNARNKAVRDRDFLNDE